MYQYGVMPPTRDTILRGHPRFEDLEPSRTENVNDVLQDHKRYTSVNLYLTDIQDHLYGASKDL